MARDGFFLFVCFDLNFKKLSGYLVGIWVEEWPEANLIEFRK